MEDELKISYEIVETKNATKYLPFELRIWTNDSMSFIKCDGIGGSSYSVRAFHRDRLDYWLHSSDYFEEDYRTLDAAKESLNKIVKEIKENFEKRKKIKSEVVEKGEL